MLNSNTTDAEDLRIYQIIDANLDRAREGLRVLEDWARFGLGKEKYVEKIKNFRQILGKNHLEVYKQSRNHIEDKCKGLTHHEQINRKTSDQIISSNSGRVQCENGHYWEPWLCEQHRRQQPCVCRCWLKQRYY